MSPAEATRAWIDGGAADEITLRANVQAWRRMSLRPRVLRGLAGSHSGIELLGRALPTPWFVAPMAHQGALHPHAEAGTALAAAALGVSYVLGCQASSPMEDVARLYLADAARGALWCQVHWLGDLARTLAFAQRAANAGFEALVLTVDAPVQGFRDRERASGFAVADSARSANLPPRPPGAVGDVLQQAPTWSDLADLCAATPLPVVLKGVLHPADVPMAIEHGASGLVVSNHGARQLDTTVSTAEALPDVVAAAKGRIPVLVDGGLRRGTDAIKALGLGANALLIGRPVAHGLATDGAQGVARVLRQLLDETTIAMALCGLREPALARQAALVGDLFAGNTPFFANEKHSRLY